MPKDVLERYVRFWVDDYAGTPRDLSADLVPGSLSGPGFTAPEIRMTGVSEQSEIYQADRNDAEVGAQFYLNDTLDTGAFTVLSAVQGTVVTVTIQFGTAAAPTTGDPEYEGEHILLNAGVGINGGAIVLNANFQPGATTAPAWGTMA